MLLNYSSESIDDPDHDERVAFRELFEEIMK
jgi:hypothetical protein